uniref:CCR4-NOT transcription complex subunit 3 n=1 Tax=Apis cerana TaxID=7461 RepID=V9ILV3_APICE
MTTPIPPSSSPQSSVSSRSSPLPANSCSPAPSTANGLIPKLPDGMSSLKSIAQQVIVRAGLEIPPSESNRNIFDSAKANNNNSNATSEAHIPPLLGVAPLGPVPLQKEHQLQFQMMEAAYYHMPHPSDSERLRSYLPRNYVLHLLIINRSNSLILILWNSFNVFLLKHYSSYFIIWKVLKANTWLQKL